MCYKQICKVVSLNLAHPVYDIVGKMTNQRDSCIGLHV